MTEEINWNHDKTKILTKEQYDKLPENKKTEHVAIVRFFGYTVEFEDGKLKSKLISDG